jgi:RNA polymerase sigma factor (TIGR02999 family)
MRKWPPKTLVSANHDLLQAVRDNAMTDHSSGRISELLQRWSAGDQEALRDLMPLVYRELRRVAHLHLGSERRDHTLASAALVNEAFLRLLGSEPLELNCREHFIGVASRLMRQILVDYSRKRRAAKRDAGLQVELDSLAGVAIGADAQIIALDDALHDLARLDERQARIVEMKFFGGLTAGEISKVMGLSCATVERDWAVARLWLRVQIEGPPPQ